MSFCFKKLSIPDVFLITPKVFPDQRGFFMEKFKFSDFQQIGFEKSIKQVNHSRSTKGVIRGLHFQLNPSAQNKMVHVVQGEIYDVAVDIRRGSATYGQWVGEYLSSENKKMLYIPEGFAHGFCVVSEVAEMTYYSTCEYVPSLERGILWNDVKLAIKWPLAHPILSKRDQINPELEQVENNFVFQEQESPR